MGQCASLSGQPVSVDESLQKQPTALAKTTLARLFLLALVVQTGFLLILPNRYRGNENSDYWTFYKPVGEQILAGNGVVDAGGRLATRYPPGYPAVIAFIFAFARLLGITQTTAIEIFDVVLATFSAILVFEIARTIFGLSVAYITFFLWLTYPANLWLMKQPNSETPFIFLFLLGVLLFIVAATKKLFAIGFLGGLLFGFAALVRPIGVFLPAVLVVAARFAPSMSLKNWAKIASAMVVGFLISITPWESYLYSKTGQFVFLCTNGPASMAQGLVFAVEPVPGSRAIWVPGDLRTLMERASAERPSMTTSGSVLKFVVREASRNPSGTLELALMKFYRPWYSTYTRAFDKPTLAYQVFYVSLGLMGLIAGLKRHSAQACWIKIFCSLVIYFWLMAFLVVPLFRYMVPAMIFILMFAAFAGEAIVERLRTIFSHSNIVPDIPRSA